MTVLAALPALHSVTQDPHAVHCQWTGYFLGRLKAQLHTPQAGTLPSVPHPPQSVSAHMWERKGPMYWARRALRGPQGHLWAVRREGRQRLSFRWQTLDTLGPQESRADDQGSGGARQRPRNQCLSSHFCPHWPLLQVTIFLKKRPCWRTLSPGDHEPDGLQEQSTASSLLCCPQNVTCLHSPEMAIG
jgi:hypothetical protein